MHIVIIILLIILNSKETGKEIILLDAKAMKNSGVWRVVNDDVMGGISTSRVYLNEENVTVFTGNVSLENNGGFASLRSPVKDYKFSGYNGIEIRIKGAGKSYSVSMKETEYFTGYFYRLSFDTETIGWSAIKLPFDDFRLYYYGKATTGKKKVPLDKIKEVSLLISDKQEGAFFCEIDYIKVY